MRRVIAGLILANVIIYLWSGLYSNSAEEDALPPVDVGHIRLLGEMPQEQQKEQKKTKQEIPKSVTAEVEPSPAAEPANEALLVEPEPSDDVVLVGIDTPVAKKEPAKKPDLIVAEPLEDESADKSEDVSVVEQVATLPETLESKESLAESNVVVSEEGSSVAPQKVQPETAAPEPKEESTETASVEELSTLAFGEDTTVSKESLDIAVAPDNSPQEDPQLEQSEDSADTENEVAEVVEKSTQFVAEEEVFEQPVVVPNICAQIGPFKSSEAAEKTKAGLPAEILVSQLKEQTYQQTVGHYVLIPAANSLEQGKKNLADLKAAGINDIWLFRSGPMKYAISLGLFSVRGNAEKHAARIRKKGFTSEVMPKQKPATKYLLLIEHLETLAASSVLSPEDSEKYKKIACE